MTDIHKEPLASFTSEAPHTPTPAEIDDLFGPTAEERAEYQAHLHEAANDAAVDHAAKVAKAVSILKKGRTTFSESVDTTSPHDEAA